MCFDKYIRVIIIMLLECKIECKLYAFWVKLIKFYKDLWHL